MNRGSYIFNANYSLRKYIFSELSQSTLNIHIKLNSITLSVTNNFTRKNIGFVHYPINNFLDADFIISRLKGLKEEEELLNYKYDKVRIVLYDHPFAVVPESLSEEALPESFYLYHQFIPDNLIEQTALKEKVKILTSLSHRGKAQLDDIFSNYQLQHYQQGFLDYVSNLKNNHTQVTTYINILEEKADILVMHGEELLFSNRFEYHSDEDILFFILSVYEQLELNVENNFLFYSGQIESNDSLHTLIKTYIRYLEPCPYLLHQDIGKQINHQESFFLDVIINSI